MRDLQLILQLKNSSTNTNTRLHLQHAKTNRRLRRHTNRLGPGVVPKCGLSHPKTQSGRA